MADSVRPFNLYLAGNALYENDQVFMNAVRFCANRFEAELHRVVQCDIKVEAKAEVEWKSLNQDPDERFFKSWASLNDNTNAYSLILVERNLFLAMMEKVCGGDISGAEADQKERKTTSVEWRLHNQITNLLLAGMKEAMSSVATFDIQMLRDPKEVTHAQRIHTNRYGNVMSDIFRVEIENVSGIIKIEYPAILVRQAMGVNYSGKAAQSRLEQLKESLRSIPLTITGAIPMMEMSYKDVMNIKKGDFLSLSDDATAEVSIGGKLSFFAELETQNGHLALELGKHVQDDDDFARNMV